MLFDLGRVAVPFRMQPGLARVDGNSLRLTPLDPASALFAEKRAAVEAGQSRQCVEGFDPAPALTAIASRGNGDPSAPPELSYEEDFAVLDGATGTLPWLCVCVPSHWAPEDKVGLGFAALHGPVADNAALVAASQQLVALVTAGDCWERWVWTISPSPRYDQHPMRQPREPWPQVEDPEAFAAQCWLRSERQVFFPAGQGTRQSVFAIRVMLQPLAHAVQSAEHALRLRDSLASMSPAVLAYKNLGGARDRLVRWLAARG